MKEILVRELIERPTHEKIKDIKEGWGYTVIGKVRPWNEEDKEYIVYSDSELFLVTLCEGTSRTDLER